LRRNKVNSNVFLINNLDPNPGSRIDAQAGFESGSEMVLLKPDPTPDQKQNYNNLASTTLEPSAHPTQYQIDSSAHPAKYFISTP
jgi:hypothetical protein